MTLGPQAVLFVHHSNDMYGADVGLMQTLGALDRDRFHPIVILPADSIEGLLVPELERLGFEYHFMPLGILRRKYLNLPGILKTGKELVKSTLRLRSMIRERNVAVVYVNTIVTLAGAFAGKIERIPVIWHVREILSLPRPVVLLLHRIVRICASNVICVSKAVREAILLDEPSLVGRAIVIYNSVRSSSDNLNTDEPDLRKGLNIPADALVVGIVGRITHWKGQDVLVDASRIVLQQHPGVHFITVGSYFSDEVHYMEQLQERIEAGNIGERFHIVGYRKNVNAVYRALNIFVLASKKPEPFGRVTVEAMMQGLPVIGTDHGGTSEIVQPGITGILVPPSDPVALASALCVLIENDQLRQGMGRAAEAYAKDHFALAIYEREMRKSFDAAFNQREAQLGRLTPLLFLHSSDDGYGSDAVIGQIISGIDQKRYYPIVVLPSDTQHIGLLSSPLREMRIEVHHLPLPILRRKYMNLMYAIPFLWRLLAGNIRLALFVRRRRIRIVHVNTLGMVACLGFLLFRRPSVIWHVHEIIERPRFVRKVMNYVVCRTSDRILCISKAVRQNILQDQPSAAHKSLVVLNAVDTRALPSKTRGEARLALGVGSDLPVIGMIGRISHWKGQELLVEAAAILRSRGILATYLIIGSIFDKNFDAEINLKKAIADRGLTDSVKLTGFRKDAATMLPAMDVFVLPSMLPEPFGLVLIEAMASRVAIVSAAHGGPLEIIRDGENGLLFAPRDPVSLAGAIERLLKDTSLRDRLTEIAHVDVTARFDIRVYTSNIYRIYSDVLDEVGVTE